MRRACDPPRLKANAGVASREIPSRKTAAKRRCRINFPSCNMVSTVLATLHGKVKNNTFYFYARPSSEGHIFPQGYSGMSPSLAAVVKFQTFRRIEREGSAS